MRVCGYLLIMYYTLNQIIGDILPNKSNITIYSIEYGINQKLLATEKVDHKIHLSNIIASNELMINLNINRNQSNENKIMNNIKDSNSKKPKKSKKRKNKGLLNFKQILINQTQKLSVVIIN